MNITGSSAVSQDGCMDDTSQERLVLSNREDWEEVYRLRAECDAILVGAETVRRDNPSLVIRDETLRSERISKGMPADIIKVTVTASGHLDPSLRFFTEGASARKIVIAGGDADENALGKLTTTAEIIRINDITAAGIATALEEIGISRLIVEGGSRTIKMFMDEDMLDNMRLAVSPKIVGDESAPKFPYYEGFELDRLFCKKSERLLSDMKIYEYSEPKRCVTQADRKQVLHAIEVSRKSIPDTSSYRVGCVIATADGKIYEGYTHESGGREHAEEEALHKADISGSETRGATVYVSMEPCSERSSKPVSCSELLIERGIKRVIYACGEPENFVICDGRLKLKSAGIETIELPEYSNIVKRINSHIK